MVNYDNEEEVQDVEAEEQEETEVEETTEETEPEEEVIDWKARAEKAEKTIMKAKEKQDRAKPVAVKDAPSTLTTKDLYALMDAKVPESDISEVEDYAALKGISVTEALKTGTIKTILAQKEEERRMAAGTNTSATRRGTSKVPDDQLMAKALKGEMPESADDIVRYNQLRWGLKK